MVTLSISGPLVIRGLGIEFSTTAGCLVSFYVLKLCISYGLNFFKLNFCVFETEPIVFVQVEKVVLALLRIVALRKNMDLWQRHGVNYLR